MNGKTMMNEADLLVGTLVESLELLAERPDLTDLLEDVPVPENGRNSRTLDPASQIAVDELKLLKNDIQIALKNGKSEASSDILKSSLDFFKSSPDQSHQDCLISLAHEYLNEKRSAQTSQERNKKPTPVASQFAFTRPKSQEEVAAIFSENIKENVGQSVDFPAFLDIEKSADSTTASSSSSSSTASSSSKSSKSFHSTPPPVLETIVEQLDIVARRVTEQLMKSEEFLSKFKSIKDQNQLDVADNPLIKKISSVALEMIMDEIPGPSKVEEKSDIEYSSDFESTTSQSNSSLRSNNRTPPIELEQPPEAFVPIVKQVAGKPLDNRVKQISTQKSKFPSDIQFSQIILEPEQSKTLPHFRTEPLEFPTSIPQSVAASETSQITIKSSETIIAADIATKCIGLQTDDILLKPDTIEKSKSVHLQTELFVPKIANPSTVEQGTSTVFTADSSMQTKPICNKKIQTEFQFIDLNSTPESSNSFPESSFDTSAWSVGEIPQSVLDRFKLPITKVTVANASNSPKKKPTVSEFNIPIQTTNYGNTSHGNEEIEIVSAKAGQFSSFSADTSADTLDEVTELSDNHDPLSIL